MSETVDFGPTATVVCNYDDDGSLECLLNNGKREAKEWGVTVDEVDITRLGYTDDAVWSIDVHSPSSREETSLGFDMEFEFDNEQVGCQIRRGDTRAIECKHLEEE